jgi:glycogen debranching enzyme
MSAERQSELDRQHAPAVGEREPARHTEGAPKVPAHARGDLLALKSEAQFVCTRQDGSIRPELASGEGFYAADTRHLSELRLTIGGQDPILLSSVMESGHHAAINATNPALGEGDASVPQDILNIRQTVLVADALHYRLRVRSFHPHPIATEVELALAADFADVFEVRGVGRRTGGRLATPTHKADRLRFAYVAVDGERRETVVEMSPSPRQVQVEEHRVRVSWDVELDGGQELDVELTMRPVVGRPRSTLTLDEAAATLAVRNERWVAACASVSSDNELFDRLIEASARDLDALMMPIGASELPAAGIPWYVAPFGRDSLLSACEMLMINPDVARGTLLGLAGLQAEADEPWRDAEPGKILHELRTGELARTGQIPHTPYYGSVDATPLFLMVAGSYYRWTLDLDTVTRLRPALDAALEWIDAWGDRDGDGFVEYERRSPAGLRNQGWKDSEDSIVHADGSLAEGPIALVEVQGYVFAAKLLAADVYEALGDGARATALREQAGALRRAFNDAFWMADEGFFALALDGRKKQVRSVTSNPAHCLYCGIVDDDKAWTVAERLMAPDMFSGWGIRTLSSQSPAYNPMSYHNGSVWPHDNAVAAAGLKRYGFDAATARIATGLFDVAAGARDFRLPELFCGFHRNESRAIVSYPVACIPQAWAAAAPFMLLQSLLGISANAPARRLTVDRPRLPSWLGSVELRGIRVGDAKVSLTFDYSSAGTTGFSLIEQQGAVHVTMSA